jgi:hypothetical protein
MALLFGLPEDLIISVYIDWITLKDVGRLDSACCTERIRPLFLRLLSLNCISFNGLYDSSYSYIHWLCLRQISIKSLRIAPRSFDEDFACFSFMRLSALVSLDLSDCDRLYEMAISFVAQQCTALTSLDMSGCQQLTDTELCALGVNGRLQKLKSLNLSNQPYNFDISDEGVAGALHACPSLTCLNLAGCISLTDVGLMSIAICCSLLQTLGIL